MSLSDPQYFARRQYSATSATLDRSIPRGEKDIATSSTVASHSLFWNISFDLKQAIESKRSSASGTQEVHKTYKHRSSATSQQAVKKARCSAQMKKLEVQQQNVKKFRYKTTDSSQWQAVKKTRC